MLRPLWNKYVRILKGRNSRSARHISGRFVSLYNRNLIADQCQACPCSSVLVGEKLKEAQTHAKAQCK